MSLSKNSYIVVCQQRLNCIGMHGGLAGSSLMCVGSC
jgi:hypothetical protein